MHHVPLLTGALDVDNVVAILIQCMVQAAQQTLPEVAQALWQQHFSKESLVRRRM